MTRGTIALLVILLAAAVPAFPEMVIHTKDGRTIRVQVEANEIANIEFVSGSSLPVPILSTLTSGKPLSGEAWGDAGGDWKFEMKITSYNPSTGAIVGEITWPSLSSVHRIRGSLAGTSLTFTETEAIRAGGAHLNVAYTFTLGSTSATGTWIDNGDKSHGGAKFSAP
ncbi:MAG: hypothetical protein NTW38_00190 [Candidatus Aminicenantes bacterium]|nr:hypothetical protein [Candidatus Aminicenantes bacterium]